MSAVVCTRCDAKLRTPDARHLCGLCVAEARHLAVSALVQNQGPQDIAKGRRSRYELLGVENRGYQVARIYDRKHRQELLLYIKGGGSVALG